MHNYFKTLILIFLIPTLLNAFYCTNEQRATMILQNIDDTTILKMCGKAQPKKRKISNNNSNYNQTQTTSNEASTSNVNDITEDNSGYIERSRFYISVSQSSPSVSATISVPSMGYEGGFDYDTSSQSIALGYIMDSNNRIEYKSTHIDDSGEYNFDGFLELLSHSGLNWYYVFGENQVKPMGIKPFISLGIGNAEATLVSQGYYNKMTGFSTSLSLGLNWSLGESFELDAAFNTTHIAWEDIDNYGMTVEAETDISGLEVALRYKF